MKKLFVLLTMMLFGSYVTYSQFEPGTAESTGFGGDRSVTANGLGEIYSVTGHYVLSADGAGSLGAYTIDVDKPSAGATVYKAFLLAASTGFSGYNIPNGCITLGSSPISWDATVSSGIASYNHYADVTTLIASIINPAAPGTTSLAVTECDYGSVDGVALLVVFADAAASEKTIVIMFGALSTTGDNFSIALGQPIDPVAPGALFDMGLGISFGFQGSAQYSIIDINGQRLTTSAGGADDAQGTIANGSLITVGGLGDLNTNPADPFALPVNHYSDDELYSILPFITSSTSNVLVATLNPSNDDNIFLSYFEISGAAIIGEGILLSQTTNTETVGTTHTVKALIQDDNGDPVPGKLVNFSVTSGPNAGANGSSNTNANGEAFFTYTDNGGAGVDDIQACFTNSQNQTECSNVLSVEWIQNGPPVPVSNWAIVLGVLLIVAFAAVRFRRIL
jgi:hypothetical protein